MRVSKIIEDTESHKKRKRKSSEFSKDNEDSQSAKGSSEKKKRKKEKGNHKQKDKALKQDLDTKSDHEDDVVTNQVDNLSVAQALSIEYAVTQLQQSINKIISESPNMKQMKRFVSKLSKQANVELDDNTRNQKLQLASKLKSLYDSKALPLFDQIINFDESTEVEGLESISLALKKKKKPWLDDNDEEEENSSGEPDQYPPPLPKIKNPSIESQVFVHKSTINNIKHLSKGDILHSHNERLEFLGDSILNTAVTQILYELYPEATEGEMSIMRSQLVSNNTLSELSIAYGFDKRLQFDFVNDVKFKSGKQKVFSDVLEAYVGGLFTDSNYTNFSEIKSWLQKLITPRLEAIEPVSISSRGFTSKDAKGELYALIGSASRAPKYVSTQYGDGFQQPFKVVCKMDEEVIGEGEGNSFKVAGVKAAMDALSKKDIIAKYSLMRMNTSRDVSVVSQKISTKLIEQGAAESQSNGDVSKESPHIEKMSPLPLNVPPMKPDPLSKGKLYAFLSRRRCLPVYKVEEVERSLFKGTLIINDVAVCFCVDASKKMATQRCATFMLQHPSLLKRCYVL
ncbi:hypothetical protein CANARDRAFT_196586 [[Candida] arabinofermentans NRRL YB-2248]|uniref:ribonuclease III n=1 Tax=[Candida] arabinofermentans NRRL YB-2248 TaxID=983967 RepID=A0A1E4T3Z7_9ASCO|nr:hypothetical protein CANARDRAFT_196586 [[Candida] arabinofermentans NRRL YB-2248]